LNEQLVGSIRPYLRYNRIISGERMIN